MTETPRIGELMSSGMFAFCFARDDEAWKEVRYVCTRDTVEFRRSSCIL